MECKINKAQHQTACVLEEFTESLARLALWIVVVADQGPSIDDIQPHVGFPVVNQERVSGWQVRPHDRVFRFGHDVVFNQILALDEYVGNLVCIKEDFPFADK